MHINYKNNKFSFNICWENKIVYCWWFHLAWDWSFVILGYYLLFSLCRFMHLPLYIFTYIYFLCIQILILLQLFIFQDTEDDISHLEWETVRVRFIKAGTLGRLVESLASDTGELESTYISVFLATYRTFASPKQVLNLLTER